MEKMTVSAPADLIEGFRNFCKEQGYSQSGLIRKLLRRTIERGSEEHENEGMAPVTE